jgi:hypothetical protein
LQDTVHAIHAESWSIFLQSAPRVTEERSVLNGSIVAVAAAAVALVAVMAVMIQNQKSVTSFVSPAII